MKKKTLIMALCALMVISTAAIGTIAFLTDTHTVKNVFTVGGVDITLEETVVNPDGTPVEPGETTDQGNQYHLIPGCSYTKDPTMTVVAGSEEAYVRMLVTITDIKAVKKFIPGFNPGDHVTGHDGTKWVYEGVEENVQVTIPGDGGLTGMTTANVYEFRYFETVSGKNAAGEDEEKVLEPLFASFTVPGHLTGEEMESLKDVQIWVRGEAIQKATFETDDDAWAAFDEQVNP